MCSQSACAPRDRRARALQALREVQGRLTTELHDDALGLDAVNDVIFVNGELPEYMRDFIKKKMEKESSQENQNLTSDGDHEPRGEII